MFNSKADTKISRGSTFSHPIFIFHHPPISLEGLFLLRSASEALL